MAIVVAVLAAATWGISAIVVRAGLQHLRTTVGTLISIASGLVATFLLVLLLHRDALPLLTWNTILFFAVIGIVNFPMGRYFNYVAIARIGVARSTPVLATGPLFAILYAVVLTHERLNPVILLGALCIIIGLVITVSPSRR